MLQVGHCYERNAIKSYLKIYKKSPITGTRAYCIRLYPHYILRARIQKFIKENDTEINQLYQIEGAEGEIYDL